MYSTHVSASIPQHPAVHSAEQDAQLLPIHRLLKKEIAPIVNACCVVSLSSRPVTVIIGVDLFEEDYG
jgi:hypothetical protein